MAKVYAQIIIDISIKSLDKVFTYEVPSSMVSQVRSGAIVEIPFGKGNRLMKGYVLGLTDSIDFDERKVKAIIRVFEDVTYEQELIELAVWMKKRYVCTVQTALRALLPTQPDVRKKQERYIQSLLTEAQIMSTLEQLDGQKRYEARCRVLEVLLRRPYIKQQVLVESAEVSAGALTTMVKNDLIKVSYETSYRMPYDVDDFDVTTHLKPNDEQQFAIDAIVETIENRKSEVFLLHGVTGSGKTEVYMQTIATVLARGESAIVLIPEIGLTPLMVRRFVERFGDVVGIMHSRLSTGEKFDQWRMAKEGELRIMIGPRSAIFAPFEHIGIIILDEEHEMTYKSEMPPKYHAREVAVFRGHKHHCPVVLGSATPLVETNYKALKGSYKKLVLTAKAASDNPLAVETVDMRLELTGGNKSVFSIALQEAMNEALGRHEQIILFLNRRGYAKFVSCRQCGYVIKCNHCDVPYNYHKYKNQLLCHYCNKSIPMVDSCPNCGSKHIREFGVGTQKVEDMLSELFPEAKVLRMDYDTTSGKHGHKEVLDKFESHQADILLGTQMVAKGHHFDNVTLVGVLAADMSLYTNDFRASERTFQLLTQVIGRSGRGSKKGRAVIQTYTPDHYSVQCAQDQDYERFYRNEIVYRDLMGYAPFKHMMLVMLTAKEEKYIIRLSYNLKDRLNKYEVPGRLDILGPAPATLSKVNDTYRRVIYVKSDAYKALTQLSEHLYKEMKQEDTRRIAHITIDINPMMSY